MNLECVKELNGKRIFKYLFRQLETDSVFSVVVLALNLFHSKVRFI